MLWDFFITSIHQGWVATLVAALVEDWTDGWNEVALMIILSLMPRKSRNMVIVAGFVSHSSCSWWKRLAITVYTRTLVRMPRKQPFCFSPSRVSQKVLLAPVWKDGDHQAFEVLQSKWGFMSRDDPWFEMAISYYYKIWRASKPSYNKKCNSTIPTAASETGFLGSFLSLLLAYFCNPSWTVWMSQNAGRGKMPKRGLISIEFISLSRYIETGFQFRALCLPRSEKKRDEISHHRDLPHLE